MRSHKLASLVVAAASLTVVTTGAEVALRRFAPVESPYGPGAQNINSLNPYIRFEYPKNYAAVTETEPGLPGMTGRNRFTTNNMGFRGDELAIPKPANELRIFVVGGSTTECFFLDDDDALARVAQGELSKPTAPDATIKVYNVGLSGAASDDHLAMIGQRLVHLEPDLIVVFAGINDLRRSILRFDYLHYDVYPEHWEPLYKRWLMKSQIVRRLYYLKHRIKPDPRRLQEERVLKSNYTRLVGLQRAVPAADALPRTDERSYAANLRSIVGITRAHGFGLVFMTQPTTWNSSADMEARTRHWMRHYDGVTYREDLMDAAMERLNDAMRAVASEHSVPLYDLAHLLPKSLEYFYDDCHFNTGGAAAAGKGLAAFLIEGGLVRQRSQVANP